MRLLITDENLIWTPENPALAPYSEIVLVVCLNGEAVTDRYECFISPYTPVPKRKMDTYGVCSEKYQCA